MEVRKELLALGVSSVFTHQHWVCCEFRATYLRLAVCPQTGGTGRDLVHEESAAAPEIIMGLDDDIARHAAGEDVAADAAAAAAAEDEPPVRPCLLLIGSFTAAAQHALRGSNQPIYVVPPLAGVHAGYRRWYSSSRVSAH